jgi:hypothetical protein
MSCNQSTLPSLLLLHVVQVRHFFKVGQARAQGKAMLRCVAAQLAGQVPGYVKLLLPVVKEHGDGGDMPLKDMFEK